MPSLAPLPIDPVLPSVIDAARDHRAVVLVAPPGSGKTTRVPPALLASGVLAREHPTLLLLQPRRVAARAAAGRIAEENGWTLGEEVGYQIRFERRAGPRTRLRVETEGILNRRLVSDPYLEGIGAVILDEFHERSIHTDLALALLNEVRQAVRDDLILVVMSATLDAGPIAAFLGDCPIIEASGRSFPVDIAYRPTTRPTAAESIAAAVEESIAAAPDEAGHVLVFLPGAEEIRRAQRAVEGSAVGPSCEVLPLHGSLVGDEQDRALRPSSRRKVILATNIAETSLTIDGVRTVIDSGLARAASYDPARGLDKLELTRISKASSTQRAGRAGRTAPGRCVRLWAEREQRGLIEADPPEVARIDLASTVLALHAWGTRDPAQFGWFEAPPPDRLVAAERLLGLLGALDPAARTLTPLGRRLLDVPAHPRLARLLAAAADDGYPATGAALAAILSEKDFVVRDPQAMRPGVASRRDRGDSDLLVRLDLLYEAETRGFRPELRSVGIDGLAARRVARVRDDLLRIARRTLGARDTEADEPPDELVLRWVLLAYPDRVVRRRGRETTGVMVGGRGIRLEPSSVVREAAFFVAIDPRDDRRGATVEARVGLASAIREEWLEEQFPAEVRRTRSVAFDTERDRVVGITASHYLDLLLREDRNAKVDPAGASEALAEALRPRATEILARDEAATRWLARVAFLRRAMPEAGWPEFDESMLGEVVAEACAGCRGADEVIARGLVAWLRARLSPEQARRLDELAPAALTVPSGNSIRLDYEAGSAPVLAARLQELFGWTQTPRLAGGRVPVVVHLLGPNYRPVQVTDDLASFWANTYFQVRKDLRARYPRHAWPDDPLTARPEAKGGRRST